MVSIPACHAGDRGSIPRLGAIFFYFFETLGTVANLFKKKFSTVPTSILEIKSFLQNQNWTDPKDSIAFFRKV